MLAASALAALGGRGHEEAFTILSALAEQVTRRVRDPVDEGWPRHKVGANQNVGYGRAGLLPP